MEKNRKSPFSKTRGRSSMLSMLAAMSISAILKLVRRRRGHSIMQLEMVNLEVLLTLNVQRAKFPQMT